MMKNIMGICGVLVFLGGASAAHAVGYNPTDMSSHLKTFFPKGCHSSITVESNEPTTMVVQYLVAKYGNETASRYLIAHNPEHFASGTASIGLMPGGSAVGAIDAKLRSMNLNRLVYRNARATAWTIWTKGYPMGYECADPNQCSEGTAPVILVVDTERRIVSAIDIEQTPCAP